MARIMAATSEITFVAYSRAFDRRSSMRINLNTFPNDLLYLLGNLLLGSLLATLLLLNSCAPAALPPPTQQPISASQLIGRWRYLGDYQQTTVEIEFLANGRFLQTVTLKTGAVKKQQGSWQLIGAKVALQNILINESSKSTPSLITWKPHTNTWWFTDASGTVNLIGGERFDPDSFSEIQRQHQHPKQTPAPEQYRSLLSY
jgi:hypothetical protein